jgi:arylsulfatase A-like enzyme
MSTNSNIQRRDFMKQCAAGATGLSLAGLTNSGCGQTASAKPNIIYIMTDDLGYGDLGCYGQDQIQTPNIDKLAAEGMRFTDHYAGSTVCAPSRCSLMTGLHTGHTQVRGNKEVRPMGQHPLATNTMTVARLLQQNGYTTGLVGKWGLGGPDNDGRPRQQGFDYFFGYICQRHAHNYYPNYLFRNEERIPLNNVSVDTRDDKRDDGAGVATTKVDYSADFFAQEALDFVDRNQANPFFLYLSLTIPHANNEAKQDGMEVPDQGPYANKGWPERQKEMAAMITRMDGHVGALMDKLKELGIDDNTLVMFTSDNGPHREGGNDPAYFNSSGPLKGIKRDLYEGGIRVPFIGRWPGKIQPGSTTNHIAAFWDFLPTAAEVAGATIPAETDGISYLPTLLGQQQKEHEQLYWEFHEGKGSKQAVRMGDWKAVRIQMSKPLELYNLATDIGETNNVAGQHPDIVATIENYLKAARTKNEFWELF